VPGPRNPKSWMNSGIAEPIIDSQNKTTRYDAEIRWSRNFYLWIMRLRGRKDRNHKTKPSIFTLLLFATFFELTFESPLFNSFSHMINYTLINIFFFNKLLYFDLNERHKEQNLWFYKIVFQDFDVYISCNGSFFLYLFQIKVTSRKRYQLKIKYKFKKIF